MYKYVVTSVDHITPSTLLVNLNKADGERSFSFQPGQYAAISFYRKHRPTPARCFSIVSSPTDTEILQFSMRARGHFTRALAKMQPGDIVKVRGPYGGFILDLAHQREVYFLAGGIGITPFISMASYSAVVQSKQKITLIYSCQNQDDIPFLEPLNKLQKQNPNFRVVYVVGDGPTDKLADQHVVSGRITPELLDELTAHDYAGPTFFMCGPPPFMNAMAKTLSQKGVIKGRIITEAFAQGSHRQTGKIRSWPYNIYALSAVGLAVGSFLVMASDFVKTLPPSSIIDPSSTVTKSKLTNARQTDLDALVNDLPPLATTTSESDAVKAAIQASQPQATTNTSTPVKQQAKTTAPSTPTPTQNATTQPTTTTAPTPTPTKQCTTTQSGVTTCI